MFKEIRVKKHGLINSWKEEAQKELDGEKAGGEEDLQEGEGDLQRKEGLQSKEDHWQEKWEESCSWLGGHSWGPSSKV